MSSVVAYRSAHRLPSSAVRPEYLKLPRDLAALTRCFGIMLPAQAERDAATLAFAIECTDRLLDAIPESGRRTAFCMALLRCFQGGNVDNLDVTPELVGWLIRLREVGERHRVHADFAEIMCELFAQQRTDADHAKLSLLH